MSSRVGGSVEVSPARADEYASLGAIVVAAYRSVDGVVMSDEYADVLADVSGRAAADGVVVLAARLDGQPVGCATVALGDSEYAEGGAGDDVAVLRMVGVDPSFRGRGAGRALVDAAVGVAREAGSRRMTLYSQSVMTAAHHLYESAGFVRRPDSDWAVPGGPSLIGYELVLGLDTTEGGPAPAGPPSRTSGGKRPDQ